MIIKKTPEEIDKIAAAGEILVRCLSLLESKVRPGVTTGELDEAAERFIRSQGATPAFKGYRGFPGSICASPNAMVVHGIPGRYRLERGDILSVDVGVVLDGWVADAARTFPVGPVSPVAQKLLAVTEASLFAAAEQCRPGQPPGRRLPRDPVPRRGGRVLGGAPAGGPRHRPLDARGPPDPQLRRPGPRARCWRRAWSWRSSRWSPPGRHAVRMGDDHWAIYSQDGSLAAHFEFTIAITAEGPRVLTPWHRGAADAA